MIGIVDVGGGLRDSFGCGILDVCLEQGVHFDAAIGISAGSCNLASFVARQPYRNLRFYTEFPQRQESMGFMNFIRTG